MTNERGKDRLSSLLKARIESETRDILTTYGPFKSLLRLHGEIAARSLACETTLDAGIPITVAYNPATGHNGEKPKFFIDKKDLLYIVTYPDPDQINPAGYHLIIHVENTKGMPGVSIKQHQPRFGYPTARRLQTDIHPSLDTIVPDRLIVFFDIEPKNTHLHRAIRVLQTATIRPFRGIPFFNQHLSQFDYAD